MSEAYARMGDLIARQLPTGVFLCVGGETPNVMTVGWGGLCYYWGKPLFVAPIRPQRFTYPLLEKERAFTISVPSPGTLGKALVQAGTLSGRDGDKFRAMGLQAARARSFDAPVIPGCALYLDCRILAQNRFTQGGTDPAIVSLTYAQGDFHTLFYGEIVASYAESLP